ncbi:MAG: hypothetical protein AAB360_01965, partial [Patescibacteria group bacterium]
KEADKVYYIKDGLIEKVEVNSHPPEFAGDVKGVGELSDIKTLTFSDKDDENEIKKKKKADGVIETREPDIVDKTKSETK